MKLFHVTERQNLSSIMRHGLTPKNPDSNVESERAIFFWACPEIALTYATEEDVVLEAHISKRTKTARRWAEWMDAYEYLVYDKIPTKNLRVVQPYYPSSCKRNCGLLEGCFLLKSGSLKAR